MFRRSAIVLGLLLLLSNRSYGAIGDPNDIYVLSDAYSEVYQYQRTSPWPYVPGNYAGSLPLPWNPVFSNATQLSGNGPYLGAVAGNNDDLFVGGFGSLQKIDGVTGANIQTVAGGLRLGPAKAPNGNVVVGGPTGTEEYDSNSGLFVRTVEGYGDGYNLHTFRHNEMFVTRWGFGGPVPIKRFDFLTGLPTGADIVAPISPQEINFGPDGALYASALYEGGTDRGLWRYDFGLGTWSQFIMIGALASGGPHGFTYDPVNNDLYMSCNTGEILRFDGLSGAYLNTIDVQPNKLTDILFHRVIPEPASCLLLGLGALAWRRRR